MIRINSYIQANQSGVAVLKNATIEICRTTPVQTTCSGKHCDKQRPLDWCNAVNRGCGCWGITSLWTSNIALIHNILITSCRVAEDAMNVRNVSFTNFNLLFMDRPIPPNTHVTPLEQTDTSEVLDQDISDCVDTINENGGFQVVLWYSRREINDQSLVGLNAQEDAQADSNSTKQCRIQAKRV